MDGFQNMKRVLASILAAALVATAQTPVPGPGSSVTPQTAPQQDAIRPTYVLGGGDQIVIRTAEMEEISEKPIRLDTEGFINLPVLGRLKAGGLTVQQLEADLVQRLKTYVRNPQVIISVVQFRSEPVFFVGAFRSPGIYPLLGRRTLVEMLASIGGLQPNASRRLKVTRRLEFGKIPLDNAVEDPVAKVSTVEISMGSLRENVNPAEDIQLQPFDVISVERAELVYVNGELAKVGAFELGERDFITVAQVLSLAGGLTRNADPKKARILRPVMNTSKRAEIMIDLTKVLSGEANDFPILPNDVLYVPRGANKRQFLNQTAIYVIPTLVSTLIWVAIR
jgi:polysaccharide export outer membrane protein